MKKKILVTALATSIIIPSAISATINIQGADAAQTAQIEKTFKDVTKTHWGYSSILQASTDGIIKGYPDGTFKPNAKVTEAEFLSMLLRAVNPTGLRDLKSGENWANPYYEFADTYNYPVVGISSKSKRQTIIDRESVAEILAATQGKNLQGNQAIQFVLDQNLAVGKNPKDKTVAGFDGKGNLTRAEAVAFVYRAMNKGIVLTPLPEQPKETTKLINFFDKYGTSEKATETFLSKIKPTVTSLGYKNTVNSNGLIIIKNGNEADEDSTIRYLGTGMKGIYVDDIEIRVTDYEERYDKNNRELLEYLLKSYGINTEDNVTSYINKLDSDGSVNDVLDMNGYELIVYKNYIERTGKTTVTVTVRLPN